MPDMGRGVPDDGERTSLSHGIQQNSHGSSSRGGAGRGAADRIGGAPARVVPGRGHRRARPMPGTDTTRRTRPAPGTGSTLGGSARARDDTRNGSDPPGSAGKGTPNAASVLAV
ncbi:hypothetical protein GCM10009525_59500 [Streptosporangium amethystogenes subsp. fukuiense]